MMNVAARVIAFSVSRSGLHKNHRAKIAFMRYWTGGVSWSCHSARIFGVRGLGFSLDISCFWLTLAFGALPRVTPV